ncbi:MAG: TrkA C-terminal domain-containing protein [Acidobacteriota bacterium]|nr:TrkA C-terminal domain-containing protein [Acidobacteriota bacterium]
MLAIERGGALLGVTAETHVEKGDQLYVCGSAEAVKMVAGLLAC